MASTFRELIGKTAEVLFETGYHFKLEYLTSDSMRWTSLKEEDKGKHETEKIYTHDIENNIVTINWIESTGISVTHIINLEKQTIWAYMNWADSQAYGGRAVLTHSGQFKLLE